jgi:hypothetical protein
MILMHLAMPNITKNWIMPIHNWGPVINQLSIKFEERSAVMKMTVYTVF